MTALIRKRLTQLATPEGKWRGDLVADLTDSELLTILATDLGISVEAAGMLTDAEIEAHWPDPSDENNWPHPWPGESTTVSNQQVDLINTQEGHQ